MISQVTGPCPIIDARLGQNALDVGGCARDAHPQHNRGGNASTKQTAPMPAAMALLAPEDQMSRMAPMAISEYPRRSHTLRRWIASDCILASLTRSARLQFSVFTGLDMADTLQKLFADGREPMARDPSDGCIS